MPRVLSGIRPTGSVHLGNYFGALKQWIDLSLEPGNICYFMIADYHALLSFRDTPLDTASYDLLAWELASGLDPEKVTLFGQSGVPAHTELAWIFNALVTVPELSRMTQYKDSIAHGLEQPNAALLTYPVLQAADILLYRADFVPVGQDQVQHIELARTLARRFNRLVGKDILTEAHPRLTDTSLILSLHDPHRKMSKSLPQGALLLEDDERTLRSKISRAVTDTGDAKEVPESLKSKEKITPSERALLYQHMSPGVRNLFLLLQETSQDTPLLDSLLANYKSKTLLYRDLKATVADSVVEFIVPLQQRYKSIRPDEAMLKAILEEGTDRASREANSMLQHVKKAFHLVLV